MTYDETDTEMPVSGHGAIGTCVCKLALPFVLVCSIAGLGQEQTPPATPPPAATPPPVVNPNAPETVTR